MKFTVEVAEVHKNIYEVELDDAIVNTLSPAELLETIRHNANNQIGESDGIDLEYSHTLEKDQWTVRDEKGSYLS
jgi:hypothetical protein